MNIENLLGRSPMFLEGDEGGGGGGGGEQVSQGAAVFDDVPSGGGGGGEPSQVSESAPAREPAAQPAQPVVDARQLAQEFGNVIGQQFKPPPRQVTPEEAKKLLNVWEPSQEWLAKYDNLESRTDALAELRDGLIRQADTIAQYRMKEMMDGMNHQYAPVVQFMQQQEAAAGEWRFKQKFPELGHNNLRPLLFAVSQNILAQGARFKNEEELFTTIANGVEAVIRVNNPEFKLGNGSGGPVPAQQNKQGRTTPGQIPVTSPGSGGGSGIRGGQGPPKPRGLAIFD